MGKRKLKGRNANRIPEKKKAKMQKTLDAMSKNRDEDSACLRDIADAKLKWAIEEREKGLKAIKSHDEITARIKIQIHKLDGVILAYNELLHPVEQEKKESKE